MIKHIPLGLGHPYRTEPFERTPHFPIAGDEITLRVCTNPEVTAVGATVEIAEKFYKFNLVCTGASTTHSSGPYGKTAKEIISDTHLSDAAARSGEYFNWISWEISIDAGLITEDFKYHFEIAGDKSETYLVNISRWVHAPQSRVCLEGARPDHVVVSDEEWLIDSAGISHTLRFALPLNDDDRVVGFGERFNSVDQRGEFLDAVVYEEYKGQGHRTYLPTPFAHILGSNYGFYLNTSRPSRYDIATGGSSKLRVEVAFQNKDPELLITFYSGNPTEVLKQHLTQVGFPIAPPAWIYKLWISSNEWNTQQRVKTEVDACLAAGINPGVLVIEAWSDESTFTVFRGAQYLPTESAQGLSAGDISYPLDGAWPDPKKMIDELHEREIKIILWQIPVLKDQGEAGSQANKNWSFALENSLVLCEPSGEPYRVRGFWFKDGLLPDLSDQQVRTWWADQRRYLVEEFGVDGFKTDGGEHAWGNDLKYLDGSNGIEKNNLFPKFYTQTFHELLQSCGKPPVTFSRAGFSGSQAFPTFWAGDENSTWEGFRSSITAGITASASGFFHWGWDIGGFSGEIPSADLFLRGTAMATFCPIMQIHSEFNHHQIPSNDRTPWNLAIRHSEPSILTIFKEFTDLRTRLIPYLENASSVAINTGRPIMAGLFFDYADDAEIWKAESQYLLGEYLLIAPVTQPSASQWKVYLPKGTWIDFWNGNKSEGGQWITCDVPLNRIPVFAKHDSPEWVMSLLQFVLARLP